MTFATIKTNIDRMVDRMFDQEGSSVDFVIASIEATKANFEQIIILKKDKHDENVFGLFQYET